jgi:hypothetical protein
VGRFERFWGFLEIKRLLKDIFREVKIFFSVLKWKMIDVLFFEWESCTTPNPSDKILKRNLLFLHDFFETANIKSLLISRLMKWIYFRGSNMML